MGGLIVKSSANSFNERQEKEDDFFNRVHRAVVTDVFVNEGTANVLFERLPYNRKVTWPLLGLSVPSSRDTDDTSATRSSWGRYVPQKGDILIIAFGNDGVAYAIGYHDIAYGKMDQLDEENESRGGIGWGESSGRPTLKPGDWDFKSARNSKLYLGGLAKLASGPHAIVLDKPNGNITIATTLAHGRYGEASETRQGGARRRVLPTDTSETEIYSARGGVAQEINNSVKFGTGVPGGTEIARESIGDVIDEDLSTTMQGEAGQYVRKLIQLKDLAGLMDVYTEKIDTGGNVIAEAPLATSLSLDAPLAAWSVAARSVSLGAGEFYSHEIDDTGNSEIEAPTATGFSWDTPMATWEVSNLSTQVESMTSWEVSAATISLDATGPLSLSAGTTLDLESVGSLSISSDIKATLDAVSVKLGELATEPVIKGTTFLSSLQVMLTQLSIDFAALQLNPLVLVGANSVALEDTESAWYPVAGGCRWLQRLTFWRRVRSGGSMSRLLLF